MERPTTILGFEAFSVLPPEAQTEILRQSDIEDLFQAYLSSSYIKTLIDNDSELVARLGQLHFGELIARSNIALKKDVDQRFLEEGWSNELIDLEFLLEHPDNMRETIDTPGFMFVFIGFINSDVRSPDELRLTFMVTSEQKITEITVSPRGDAVKTTNVNPALIKYYLIFRKDMAIMGHYPRESEITIEKAVMGVTGDVTSECVAYHDLSDIWKFHQLISLSKKFKTGDINTAVRLPNQWTGNGIKLPVIAIETEADVKGMLELLAGNGGIRFWNAQ
uniref:F-box domain-containing protein n=1 Tax=Pithovirus LCPAC103 TaxID=2506588 RepID=A0A481Z3S3_9VIRU|nr:MAG: hypothetical protein LCPAC103_01850 [Pithovirus LCPAC103]